MEKVVVGLESADIMVAPFMWINANNPILPMVNPGTRPLYIREGEIIGRLADPS